MSHKSRENIKEELVNAADKVDVGAAYIHSKSGKTYIVEGFSILEATDQILVGYCSAEDTSIEFSRPLDEFTELVDIDGRTLPRFERVD